jgi:hypothetical protein
MERHGRNGRVIVGVGVGSQIVKLTKWTLNQTKDKVDVSGFGDSNKRYVFGKGDLTGTLAGWWDDANDKLFDSADAGVPVHLYLYPDAVNAATQFWHGEALIDASIEVDSNGAIGISGSFAATDNWTRAGVA